MSDRESTFLNVFIGKIKNPYRHNEHSYTRPCPTRSGENFLRLFFRTLGQWKSIEEGRWKNREIDLNQVEISMATKPEKVVYNITLQSEEDEEVKVIDRLHPRGLQLKAFLMILKLVPA